MATLDNLPTEIVDSIFELVPLADKCHPRLSRRRIGAIGGHHVMKELEFGLWGRDFQMLPTIASHLVLPEYYKREIHEYLKYSGKLYTTCPLSARNAVFEWNADRFTRDEETEDSHPDWDESSAEQGNEDDEDKIDDDSDENNRVL
ncbi:hypothetical protein B0H67DRAFT_647969 [Lasiosphaeris hirsuta]|uniref:F-box domain-containing protein n=1 Tax=Lasiosphaeris hirsuta TaxID=260670 RepID=A0AA40DNZ8_9PEZI|nr:hypothetical protein B0H67DRAFT_647969 [Lasiosphaeris hirsuta]